MYIPIYVRAKWNLCIMHFINYWTLCWCFILYPPPKSSNKVTVLYYMISRYTNTIIKRKHFLFVCTLKTPLQLNLFDKFFHYWKVTSRVTEAIFYPCIGSSSYSSQMQNNYSTQNFNLLLQPRGVIRKHILINNRIL